MKTYVIEYISGKDGRFWQTTVDADDRDAARAQFERDHPEDRDSIHEIWEQE